MVDLQILWTQPQTLAQIEMLGRWCMLKYLNWIFSKRHCGHRDFPISWAGSCTMIVSCQQYITYPTVLFLPKCDVESGEPVNPQPKLSQWGQAVVKSLKNQTRTAWSSGTYLTTVDEFDRDANEAYTNFTESYTWWCWMLEFKESKLSQPPNVSSDLKYSMWGAQDSE